MYPNIIGTNSLYRFKQYKVLSCALISDLYFPPLYWMETFRFLALSGLDMKNIYENAYFHILNSENWQEKNALKNLIRILVLPTWLSLQRVIYNLFPKWMVWTRQLVFKLCFWNISKGLRVTMSPFFLLSNTICHQNYLNHNSKCRQNYTRAIIKTTYFLACKSCFTQHICWFLLILSWFLVSIYNKAQIKIFIGIQHFLLFILLLKFQSCSHHNWFLWKWLCHHNQDIWILLWGTYCFNGKWNKKQ